MTWVLLMVGTLVGAAYAAMLGADPGTAHDVAAPFAAVESGLWAYSYYRAERHGR
jgi:hypothetical protein